MLVRAADRGDRAHAPDGEQVEGAVAKHGAHRGHRIGPRPRPFAPGILDDTRFVAQEIRHRQREQDDQDAEDLQRAAPAERADQPRRQLQDQIAADADAEIREAHRPAARLVEPPREQHLVGQRAAADVAERVEDVEQVEHPQRGHVRQADQRAARHDDARHHHAPRTEAIDDPAGGEPEQRPDQQLADGIARGHLHPRPAELLHHEVVVERQAVEREADDREQRDERRQRRVVLPIDPPTTSTHSSRRAECGGMSSSVSRFVIRPSASPVQKSVTRTSL